MSLRFKLWYTLLIAILSPLFLCASAQVREPGEPEFRSLFNTAMQEGVSCYRIPALVTCANGDLIAAIDERVPSCGDLRMSRDINILIRRSSDNGDSWSAIQRIVDYPHGQSASDPSMIVDGMTGDVLLFFNYMDLDQEPDVYCLRVMRSSDNGRTWGAPEDITSQITKPEWHKDFMFITSGRGMQTSDGRLLHTLVNLQKGLYVFGSTDHGISWFLQDHPLKPGDESKIVETEKGTWMVNSRVNRGGYRHIHLSRDEGRTWESYADTNLIDPGCNASIICYTSEENGYDRNRLLFINARMKDSRSNLTLSLSYDQGKSWPVSKCVYEGSAAYSSMTVLKNGDIGLFFEKDDYTDNVFVSLSLDWLTDGKDSYTVPIDETF